MEQAKTFVFIFLHIDVFCIECNENHETYVLLCKESECDVQISFK